MNTIISEKYQKCRGCEGFFKASVKKDTCLECENEIKNIDMNNPYDGHDFDDSFLFGEEEN